jgi:hypothetical protein
LYVLDTDSILALPHLIPDDSIISFLEELVPFIESGNICFPDLVLSECRRIAEGEVISLWIRAVSGSRRHRNVPYSHTVKVLGRCIELLDGDDSEESSQVAVAAMTDYLCDKGVGQVHVVTDDRGELPTRISMAAACSQLGFLSIETLCFIKNIGLDHYLHTW